ncbi:MAG: sugar isomerase domain-containing protein [Candidatus Zipacnadales bacterium]
MAETTAARRFFDTAIELLRVVSEDQAESIEQAAQRIADVVRRGRLIHTFGCGHSGLLAQEIFFRSAGLMLVNYVHAPGQTLDVRPVHITSHFERLSGYSSILISGQDIQPDDVVIVISSSGRNAAPIEFAMEAKRRGAYVIALCSMVIAKSGVTSRHTSGTLLHEHADLVLDNHIAPGDAMVHLENFPQAVGPMSTVVGAALLEAVVARAIEILAEETTDLPVFINANVEGGTEHNERWIARLRSQLPHL